MYSPSYNRLEDRRELLEFMRANSFAVLVTGTGGTLHASHLPVLVREAGEKLVLDMHMAKNNPQWQEFFDDEVLVIFTGPHAYVSPSWYAERGPVPTWAYVAVHCYGTAVLHDGAGTERNIARLVERMEGQRSNRWSMSDLEPAEKDELIANVVSFEIPVTRMEAKFKVNQRDRPERVHALIAELERSGDAELASYVRRYNPT